MTLPYAKTRPSLPRRIKELLSRERSEVDIAKELGVDRRTVAKVRQRLGLERRLRRIAIDDAFFAQLKELHAQGLTDREIAFEIGAAPQTIQKYRIDIGLRMAVREPEEPCEDDPEIDPSVPWVPVKAPPLSEEKIEAMTRRASAGHPLFHPQDGW